MLTLDACFTLLPIPINTQGSCHHCWLAIFVTTLKLLRSYDVIIELASISAVDLQWNYGTAKVYTTHFLSVISLGRHCPREIWMGTCPPRHTLGYVTGLGSPILRLETQHNLLSHFLFIYQLPTYQPTPPPKVTCLCYRYHHAQYHGYFNR